MILQQHLLHLLKATSTVQIQMLKTLRSLCVKMTALKQLLKDLTINLSDLNEICVELSVVGNFSYNEAVEQAKTYISLWSHTEESGDVHNLFGGSSSVIDDIESSEMFAGRDTSNLSALQKHHLARLFNSLEFNMGCWIRHLKQSAYPSQTIVQGEVQCSMPVPSSKGVAKIEKAIKTREPPKQPYYVCAVTKNWGCSKSFPNVQQLAKWIAEQHPHDWKLLFTLSTTGSTKQLPFSVAFQSQVSYLSSQYDHEIISIRREEFMLFDAPQYHQCLFHSLERLFKPLYTTSHCPTRSEIRKAVIEFYQTCPRKLMLNSLQPNTFPTQYLQEYRYCHLHFSGQVSLGDSQCLA